MDEVRQGQSTRALGPDGSPTRWQSLGDRRPDMFSCLDESGDQL